MRHANFGQCAEKPELPNFGGTHTISAKRSTCKWQWIKYLVFLVIIWSCSMLICQPWFRWEWDSGLPNNRSDSRPKKEKTQETVDRGALCRGNIYTNAQCTCIFIVSVQIGIKHCFAGYWTQIWRICRWGKWILWPTGKWCFALTLTNVFQCLFYPSPHGCLRAAAAYIFLLCVNTTLKRHGVVPFLPNFSST